VGLIWGWVYAPYGYSGRDEGLIAALSWRVTQGQLPYLDFQYLMPPLTPLLHALPQLWLPDAHQFLFERYLFFFLIATSCILSVGILDRHFSLDGLKLNRYALALLFFVFSTGNFPPMAWPSVDGVVLCTAGLYFLSCRDGRSGAVVGAGFLFLGAMCKQSYHFMLPAALIYTWMARVRRDVLLVAVTFALLGTVFAATLAGFGILGAYLEQTTLQTRFGSLVHSGFLVYFKYSWLAVGPSLAAAILTYAVGRRLLRRSLAPWMPFIVIGGTLVVHAGFFFTRQQFQTPVYNYPAFLWLATVVALACAFERHRRDLQTLAWMLFLSWCASLSWGYQTPAFYSASFLFGLLYFSRRHLGSSPRALLGFLLTLGIAVQFVGYQFPYGERPRWRLDSHLGQVYDKLSGVYSSSDGFDRQFELRRLHERYGDDYMVFPAMPLTHFLTRTLPPARTEWVIDRRVDHRIDEIIESLEARGTHVFLERDSPYLCHRPGQCSRLVEHIGEHWRRVEEGAYFDVYRPPAHSRPGA